MSLVIVKAAHGLQSHSRKYNRLRYGGSYLRHDHIIDMGFQKAAVPTDVECRCLRGFQRKTSSLCIFLGCNYLGWYSLYTLPGSQVSAIDWWILAPPSLTFFHLWTHSSSYSLTQPVSPSHIQTAKVLNWNCFQHQPLHTVPRTGVDSHISRSWNMVLNMTCSSKIIWLLWMTSSQELDWPEVDCNPAHQIYFYILESSNRSEFEAIFFFPYHQGFLGLSLNYS